MKKSSLEIMIENLKNGEKIICKRCQKGNIIYEKKPDQKYPSIYCNNPKCNAKVIFN